MGVIHPIESYWLYWGTEEMTGGIRREMDDKFEKLIEWLLYGLIDFDFISESLLPELNEETSIKNSSLKVGEMKYDVIVVPNCVTIRETTLSRLKKFVKYGGKVIFTGGTPKLVDAVPSESPMELMKNCRNIGFDRYELLNALEEYRDIDIRNELGIRTNNIIYQLRKDGENEWLFLAHVNKMSNPDIPKKEELTITIKGTWKAIIYDAVTGKTRECKCEYSRDNTILFQTMFEHDSLLLKLVKTDLAVNVTREDMNEDYIEGKASMEITVPSEVSITLSEPNVYLLDLAEYRFDEENWQPREEILRIDNLFRKKLGYPLRMEAFAQPWVDEKEEGYEHKLSLRFEVFSDVAIQTAKLALENPEITNVSVNGIKAEKTIDGWYTDRDIKTIILPELFAGRNEIIVEILYNSRTNIEAMYLLGDFGVKVSGSNQKIISPMNKIGFGDITSQGLPFYGGNITYNLEIETMEGDLTIQVSQFRNPVIKVLLDGEEKGYIAYSPYILQMKDVKEGVHKLQIVTYGNRVNTFGTIHNCNKTESWIGPNAWRTTGTSWAYEYQLKPTGILISPQIRLRKHI
ncbi:type 1 glutamine amidotransferase family protein [Anaerocolumna sedimenticola]|uniref:hypothetical protein n=1 Tax=Anaerocolumna sedimenticola TaxID=2696063 RepID=UPI001FE4B7CE|nr:hypothetical protein [Anaerocolumna sedimenticola]